MPAAVIESAEAIAVHVMWALSGRQFGLTLVRYRPPVACRHRPTEWWEIGSLRRALGCGCPDGGRVVRLPGPVAEVVEVRIGDEALPVDGWRLEGDRLYRVGAAWLTAVAVAFSGWPPQNLDRPLPEPGTWSVTYLQGLPVPAGVDRLTGLLAKEFIAACTGAGKCRLPRTLVGTTARGVVHSFDPAKILAAGKTGIPEIDLWLSAVNPRGLAEPPRVV